MVTDSCRLVYREYIRLVEQYNTRNLPVQHGIQTNGVLLDEEWADFLATNNFLVGLSLDGTRGNHDRYRLNPQGEGSFSQVWPKVELLREHKVDFNILTVITGYCPEYTDYLSHMKRDWFINNISLA